MPGPEAEDRLRSALEELATPADPAAAYERIVEKKIRRQIMRRFQVAGLIVVVLIGTVGGTVILATAFRGKPSQRTAIAPSAENGKIAFVSNRSGERSDLQAVSVMNPDGTHVVGVAGPQVRRTVALSPDGTRIAYSVGLNEIVVANADGTDEKVLTYVSDLLSPPAWSSDGTRIAYAPGPIFDVEVIRVGGGKPVHLTRPPSGCTDNYPMWSPDARHIAFLRSCGAPGATDVYVMNADGSGQVNLTRGSVETVFGGSWSPTGTKIAFVIQVKHGGNAYVANRFQIATIRIDGSGFRQLTTEGDNTSPVWSPDGKLIAFTSNRGGRSHVYRMSADGTGQSDLTPDSSVEAQVISWLPATASSVLPSESPLATPPVTPVPSVTPSGSPPPPYCEGASVAGDFDGDGRLDTAAVCPVPDGYSLGVTWGSGSSGAVALTPDPCQNVCEPVAAADLDGDGSDEFVLLTKRGASTEFLAVYELPVSEAFGQHPATVAEPGAPGFPAGQPAVFPIDGSVTHLDFLTCQTADDGTHQVIATSAVLDTDQTEYRIQEVVFVLDPEADSYGQFVLVSSTSSAFAAVPTGASRPEPRGEPCWEPAPQSSPSSIP